MTRVVRAVAWAPVFVMMAWVLSVVEHADVGIEPAVRTTVVAVLAALVISIACTMVLRDVPRGGAIATLLVMGLLAGRTPAVWAAVLAAIVLILIERWRARSVRLLPWPRIHEAVTILTLVLMILGGVRVGMQLAGHPVIAFDPAWAAQVPSETPKPNIYLLLVDGRGRSDVLESYGYDSSPYIDRLGEMGFRVAQHADANYAATRFTLASMLAGSHLDQLGMDLSMPVDEQLVFEAIRQAPIWPLLERAGYRTIVIPSGWDHLPMRGVDEYLADGSLTEFETNALGATGLGALAPTTVTDWWVEAAYQRTLNSLARLREVAGRSSGAPRSVFVHVPVPHQPFAFEADCDRRPSDKDSLGSLGRGEHAGTPATERLAADQTACIDGLVADALQEVVTRDPTATIVVFSDHGPEERLDWQDPQLGPMLERHATFLAARSPGDLLTFPDDITLVNVLPRLLKTVLGVDLPDRADELYFGPSRSTRMLVPMSRE